jgi:hypothetical protein
MSKTAFLLTLIVTALASMSAHAQPVRVFVSGHGLDTNPCSESQPCRTFQQAFNTVAVNGEIQVLDPAGYGPLTITHGISIQAHGFGGIMQAGQCLNCAAIWVSVTTSDPVMLNGLVIDGVNTGQWGIYIASGASVQILNSIIRHFKYAIYDYRSTNGSNLLVEDTIASDNVNYGIIVFPHGGAVTATLNRITANNNGLGVGANPGVSTNNVNMMVANSVMSNNSSVGLSAGGGVVWLAKTVISGNGTGVVVGGKVNSYGDNYIRDNGTPVSGGGSFTTVTTQ